MQEMCKVINQVGVEYTLTPHGAGDMSCTMSPTPQVTPRVAHHEPHHLSTHTTSRAMSRPCHKSRQVIIFRGNENTNTTRKGRLSKHRSVEKDSGAGRGLECGACTEEGEVRKKERKKNHSSLSVLVPCFHLTWREEALVCRCQT